MMKCFLRLMPSPLVLFVFLPVVCSDAADEADSVPTKTIPLAGKTSGNGWTYHGGYMLVQGMAADRDEKAIWLATNVGLVRFDLEKKSWQRWTTLDGLKDNYAYDVDLDRDGNVWVATFSGVSRFDGKTFRNWGQREIGHHRLGRIAVDTGGRIWTGCPANRTPKGAMCLVPSGLWVRYDQWTLDSVFMHAVVDIAPDDDGGVWISGNEGKLPSDTGAGYYQAQQPRLFHIDRYGTPEQITLDQDVWPREMVVERSGHLLAIINEKKSRYLWNASPSGKLYRLSWQRWIEDGENRIPDFWKTSWEPLDESAGLDAPVRTICRDRAGKVWIATERAIGTLVDGKFAERIPLPKSKAKFLSQMIVLRDGKQAVIFTIDRTNDTGIVIWDGSRWTQFVNPLDGPALPGRGMPIIDKVKRDLDGRLHFIRHVDTVYDGKSWKVEPPEIEFIHDQHGRVVGTYRQNSAANETVMRLKDRHGAITHREFFGVDHFAAKFRDSRGHFWSFGDELLEFDGKKIIDHGADNRFFLRKIPGVGIYNRTIKMVAEDSKGRLWASTSSGLMRYSGQGTKWNWVGGRFDGMFGMMGWHVVSNGRDIISYAGTWGTSEYDMLAGRWLNFTQKGRDIPGVEDRHPGSYVEAAAADVDGHMWYGTYEGGVARRNSDSQWQYFTTDDGLACNSCWGIWSDDDGTMWFTSQSGTQKLNLREFRRKRAIP